MNSYVLVIEKKSKQPKCTLIGKWIKDGYGHNKKLHCSKKKNDKAVSIKSDELHKHNI